MRRILPFILLLLSCYEGFAQIKGQTPPTAFPVCGTSIFQQSSVPPYVSHNLIVPGCTSGSALYQDINPFWYTFTCFQSGTLGFVITPHNLSDDYDWQLWDVTGRNPNDVFTDASLIVTGNWAATPGKTGASNIPANRGLSYIGCASDPIQNNPVFSLMPNITQGHTYLLMVSHFTSSNQSGYDLSFGEGTAVITDTTKPRLKAAYTNCAGNTIYVKLNKKMSCASLVADGSDFSLSTSLATITSITGVGCSAGFDMDSLVITLSNNLPAGTYQLIAQTGTDGNTLLDICQTQMDVGENINFTVAPAFPTLLDSIVPVKCAPSELVLVFDKLILCNSIEPGGSDFFITGPSSPVITGTQGTCDANGETRTISLKLASPLTIGGTYTIHVQTGSDGNTLVNECGLATPVGSSAQFSASDTVSAAFTHNIRWGCRTDTIEYFHSGANNVSKWAWTFDGTNTTSMQNPVMYYKKFGLKTVQLIVSNSLCSDTSMQSILLDNELKAMFSAPDFLCPEDFAIFKDSSIGNIISYQWNFGDGGNNFSSNPPPRKYVVPTRTLDYIIKLIVTNNRGCSDTATKSIRIVNNCYIAVPSAFTPNGDGLNDYLYPLNAYKAMNLEFNVYSRTGQNIFSSNDWMHRWDGTYKGIPQPPGTYVWTLSYVDIDTKEKFFKKGTVVLIR